MHEVFAVRIGQEVGLTASQSFLFQWFAVIVPFLALPGTSLFETGRLAARMIMKHSPATVARRAEPMRPSSCAPRVATHAYTPAPAPRHTPSPVRDEAS
jgi:hypothetical protein